MTSRADSDIATLQAHDPKPLVLDGVTYTSRLLAGTGRYRTLQQMHQALAASGAEIVTVAVGRAGQAGADLLSELGERYTILPNTAGAHDVAQAVRLAHLGRELLDGQRLVKLEVIGERQTLHPDVVQTIEAAHILVREGFAVLPYTSDDPVVARQLEDAGCIAVMPLAGPIGSGLGIGNPEALIRLLEVVHVPVVVDAGVGTASDAAIAMELGCDAVLMNTALAEAREPALMASAMRHGVIAGRMAYLAGRMPRRHAAVSSSPAAGLGT